jgi:hypothetical protein
MVAHWRPVRRPSVFILRRTHPQAGPSSSATVATIPRRGAPVPVPASEQSVVQLAVLDLGGDTGLAGFPDTRVAFDATGPGVVGYRQRVSGEQPLQRLDVPCLGLADVAEGPHLAEIFDHLVVGGPGAILVVERLLERSYLGMIESTRISSSGMKSRAGCMAREAPIRRLPRCSSRAAAPGCCRSRPATRSACPCLPRGRLRSPPGWPGRAGTPRALLRRRR